MSQCSAISFNRGLIQAIMQRVCHLTTVHPRNDTRIFIKECKSLALAGFDMHLVVGDGIGDCFCEDIQIHDIGSIPRSRISRMYVQPRLVLEKVLAIRPVIVHFHDPELLPLGVKLTQKGIRVIYDAHEDVPRQILTKHWIPKTIRPLVAKIIEYYENRSVKKLAGVITATPLIDQRFSLQGLKTVNVNNYPLPAELAPMEGNISRQNRICYVGVISRLRGLLPLIRALPLVPEIRLTLCGKFSGAGFETELSKERGWAQVDYLGSVNRTSVRRVMAESFAGIVTLLPSPNHVDSQPNKLFEYMSAELPVIASHFPLWRKIIDEAHCGLCVNPDSPEQIASAIRTLLNQPEKVVNMGRSGRQVILTKYNWPLEAKKLIDFYKRVLKQFEKYHTKSMRCGKKCQIRILDATD